MPRMYVDPKVKDRATLDSMPSHIRKLLLHKLLKIRDSEILAHYEYDSVDALKEDLHLIGRG